MSLPRASSLLSALGLALAACSSPPADVLEDHDPQSLTFVAPQSDDAIETGEAVTISVRTENTTARTLELSVDGRTVGQCNRDDAESDCFDEDTFSFSTAFDTTGTHTLSVRALEVSNLTARLDLTVTAASDLDPTMLGSDDSVTTDSDSEAIMADGITGTRGYLDPERGMHDLCGGQHWRVHEQRVELSGEDLDGARAQAARCVERYGASISHYADAASVSRASVVAALATAGDCEVGTGFVRAPLGANACAALNPGVTAADCRTHMLSTPDFAIQTLVRYLSSHHALRVHRRDAPRIAAYLNRGGVHCSRANDWHIASQRNFIDRYVRAYNAYRFWEATAFHVPVCDRRITVTVALYNYMAEPQTNGCWTVERVSKTNRDWRICNYDGTVYHSTAGNWAYDDTNTYNSYARESDEIARCARGAHGHGYVYMANRGAGWRRTDPGGVAGRFFAELYSSEYTVDDQLGEWLRHPSVGDPMINVGHAAAGTLHDATLRVCDHVGNHGHLGLYTSQPLEGDRLAAVASAIDRCTLQ